jgi:hypothetical protein
VHALKILKGEKLTGVYSPFRARKLPGKIPPEQGTPCLSADAP